MEIERKYLLEKVGKVTMVQLYADGFEELSLEDKILCVPPKTGYTQICF